jgi:hypothetical protein
MKSLTGRRHFGFVMLVLVVVAASCSSRSQDGVELGGEDSGFRVVSGPALPIKGLISGIGDTLQCENAAQVVDNVSDIEGFAVGPLEAVAFLDAGLSSQGVYTQGQREPDHDPKSARRLSKIPIMAKNGSTFTLLIHPDSQGNALMSWGRGAELGFAVTVEACDQPVDGWSVFGGGIWVLEPECVTVIVQRDSGETTSIDLPVVKPCP